MGIPGVEPYSPAGHRCQHLAKPGHCSIYKDRPKGCRLFKCAWLQSDLGPEFRPDKCNLVMQNRPQFFMMFVDEKHPEAWTKPLIQDFIKLVIQSKPVCVIHKDKRRQIIIAPGFDLKGYLEAA